MSSAADRNGLARGRGSYGLPAIPARVQTGPLRAGVCRRLRCRYEYTRSGHQSQKGRENIP
eukprot:3470063-Pyramimonas_sp.AAC.1